MIALKRKILNAERTVFQWFKKRVLELHYRFVVTTVLPPVSCQIEVTTVCNYNCVMCNRNFVEKERKNKMMSLEEFQAILRHLPRSLKHIFFVGQLGDAFCHPHFHDFLDIATKRNYHISIATNGARLTKERIDQLTKFNLWRLHVSLDSTDQETYSSIRGGNIEKVIDNLKYFKEKNVNTSLYLAMVLMKNNVDGIDGFLETAKKLGANLIVLQMMIPYSMQIWSEQSLYNYPDKLGNLVKTVKHHIENSGMDFGRGGGSKNWDLMPVNGICDSAFSSPQIMVNGDVVPCCIVSNAEEEFTCGIPSHIKPSGYVIGNVLQEPMLTLWNNKKIKQIRKEIINSYKYYNGILKSHDFNIKDFEDIKRGVSFQKPYDYCKVCALRWQVGG